MGGRRNLGVRIFQVEIQVWEMSLFYSITFTLNPGQNYSYKQDIYFS